MNIDYLLLWILSRLRNSIFLTLFCCSKLVLLGSLNNLISYQILSIRGSTFTTTPAVILYRGILLCNPNSRTLMQTRSPTLYFGLVTLLINLWKCLLFTRTLNSPSVGTRPFFDRNACLYFWTISNCLGHLFLLLWWE